MLMFSSPLIRICVPCTFYVFLLQETKQATTQASWRESGEEEKEEKVREEAQTQAPEL